MPLGEFLDEQIAKAKDIENAETDEITETDEVFGTENYETPIRPSSLDMSCLIYLRVMLWMKR